MRSRFFAFLLLLALSSSARTAAAEGDEALGFTPMVAIAGGLVAASPYLIGAALAERPGLPTFWGGLGVTRGFGAMSFDARLNGTFAEDGLFGWEGRSRSELLLHGGKVGYWAMRLDSLAMLRLVDAPLGRFELLAGGSMFPYLAIGREVPDLVATRPQPGGFGGGPMAGLRAGLWFLPELGLELTTSYAYYRGLPFTAATHNLRMGTTLVVAPWARTPGAEIPVGFYAMYEHDRFFAGAERSDHALHFGVRLSFPSQSEGRVLRRDM
ncbi:MAG: hypothetical protein R3B72_43875 [Polyangiaceae bacterium]